jgi:signal transduction histidine kinase
MPLAADILLIFQASPAAQVVLSPSLVIEAVTEAYLLLTNTTRAQLVGQAAFDVFGGPPGSPQAATMANLSASLQQVLATGQPQSMPPQHYDLPDPTRPGHLAERYWLPTNTPVLGPDGEVCYVLHQVEDITARVRTERQLHETQAREQAAQATAEAERRQLREVLARLPAQVAVYRGPDHVYDFVNARYQTYFPRQAFMGQPIAQALPEAATNGVLTVFDQVYRTGEAYHNPEQEFWLTTHDHGQPRQLFLSFTLLPLRDAHGHITGLLDFSYDVTAQVLACRQVQQLNQELEARVQERTHELTVQRQQLGQILAQVPAAIATLEGPEHRYSFFNDPYQALSAQRTVLGQTVADVFPEVIEQGFIELLDQVYATGQPFIGTEILVMLYEAATGQPEVRYADFIYQPLVDDAQRITGILAFILDVTGRVRTRKQIDTLQAAMLAVTQRQAQERQQVYQLFEQLPAAIMLLREPGHRVEYVNPAYQQFFPGQALQGYPLGEVHPRAASTGALARLDRAYLGETYVGLEEAVTLHTAAGEAYTRYFNFTYQPYCENGQVVGVSIVAIDATEQSLARQQVQELNQELAASNAALTATNASLYGVNQQLTRTNADLDTFVYSASHDLKAPITNIEGLLQALRYELPPAALATGLVPHLLGMMDGAVERFQQTLGHLTDVSRLHQAQADAPEAVDLLALVEAVRLDMLPELQAARTTLTVDLDSCPTLHFAAKNLRSILYNLLSNAVKYRDPARAPHVQLRCRREPGLMVLEVEDNGLGLSEGQQQELFRLFRRLHTHVSGSGVGLYMVKKMVDNAGGTLAVRSEPGVGSTFTVTLPALPT